MQLVGLRSLACGSRHFGAETKRHHSDYTYYKFQGKNKILLWLYRDYDLAWSSFALHKLLEKQDKTILKKHASLNWNLQLRGEE